MTITHILPITGTVTDGVDAVQTLQASDDLTEGAFKLTINEEETGELPFNATAEEIAAALAATEYVGGAANVSVTGGGMSDSGKTVNITFTGALAGMPVEAITVTSATSLVGGTIGVTQTATGVVGSYRGFPKGAVLIKTDGIGIAHHNTGTPNTPTWTVFEGYAVAAVP